MYGDDLAGYQIDDVPSVEIDDKLKLMIVHIGCSAAKKRHGCGSGSFRCSRRSLLDVGLIN